MGEPWNGLGGKGHLKVTQSHPLPGAGMSPTRSGCLKRCPSWPQMLPEMGQSPALQAWEVLRLFPPHTLLKIIPMEHSVAANDPHTWVYPTWNVHPATCTSWDDTCGSCLRVVVQIGIFCVTGFTRTFPKLWDSFQGLAMAPGSGGMPEGRSQHAHITEGALFRLDGTCRHLG